MLHIKEYRKKGHYTLKQLGALVGASESAMSLYESGKREPDYEMLLKISEVLGCCVDELLRGSCDHKSCEDSPSADPLHNKIARLDDEDRGRAESYIDWLLSADKYQKNTSAGTA